MKKFFCAFVTVQIILSAIMVKPAMAQMDPDDIVKNTQEDIMIVAAAGAAGAVLGLSTLSFVDKPSNHLSNIWTGAALGVIAGVIFVAYNSAQKGSEELQSEEASVNFSSLERVAWHQSNTQNLTLPSVQFGTQIFGLSF